MVSKVLAMIPARLDSTRLPKKLLLEANNKPLICHTVERVLQAQEIGRVVVCTDSFDLAERVEEWFDTEEKVVVKYQNFQCECGSDRNSVSLHTWPYLLAGLSKDCVLGVHGDEVNINPQSLDRLIDRHRLNKPHAAMTQLLSRTHERDTKLRSSCKVEVDWDWTIKSYSRDEGFFYTAQGAFCFDLCALLAFHKFGIGLKETISKIEQYRLLELGLIVRGFDAGLGDSKTAIDTKEDFDRFVSLIQEY